MNQTMNNLKKPVLIITGLSGAGMSSCLKHLEDLGYEVFDNFPLALAAPLVAQDVAPARPIAIAIDTRTRGFDPDALREVVRQTGATLVFMTADEAVLQKRFTETRRRHPLAQDRPASAGIKKEQAWLYPLREKADEVIDTSMLTVPQLRGILEQRFGNAGQAALAVTLMSFGYKHATPREADIVLDVRFLKNPHWVPELKALTGLDEAVGAYVALDPDYGLFMENLRRLLAPLLPRYAAEGKSYLTVAIGCTGGRHRSVYAVETLRPWLEGHGFHTHIIHRDIDR